MAEGKGWAQEACAVTMTNGEWNGLYCYLLGTVGHIEGKRKAWEAFAEEKKEDGSAKYPKAAGNAEFYRQMREKLDGWVLKCEKDDANIIAVVEDGLKSGAISIPGTVADPNGFDAITNVTGYLNAFSTIMAERIRNQFTPLHDPATEPLSPEILSINRYIQEHAGYPLYNAQLAVAEAVMRKLKTGKSAFIVAECGSGKTKIGATAMAALHALKANQMQQGKSRTIYKIFFLF